jgi:single-stranded-DNA-specific exonuclease
LRTTAKAWRLLPHDAPVIDELASSLRTERIVAQLLYNRGVASADAARRFLDASLSGLHSPELLPGVADAADRIYRAVKEARKICIYGDYDVDGITGTTLLVQCLRLLGATNVEFYVPHRLEEGYGLNADALRQIALNGAQVVVTVDCGICSHVEADVARQLGLELIITDHHEPKASLPAAAAVVHPRLPGGAYPFGHLCGAAVAFKLAWALCQKASGGGPRVAEHFKHFLVDGVALVALGTVADCVPLHDENRIFVRHGLARLPHVPSLGLKALLTAAGLHEKATLRATDISFGLAPRLNASSRLGCARLLLELLTTTNHERANTLARFLDGQNEQRQQIERRILTEARAQIETLDLEKHPALVLIGPEWHVGVIGIVASRLVEQYARPVLMIALRHERGDTAVVGQGSGRSFADFPLHEALAACDEHLLGHGGHKAAAGFRIQPEKIDAFREQFCAQALTRLGTKPPAPRLTIDAEAPLSALTFGLVKQLDRLEPYGMENRRPLFLTGGLQVTGTPRRVGGGERHLRFQIAQNRKPLWAIAFGHGENLDELMSDQGRCCLAYTPRINEWQGRRSLELEVADFQAGPEARLV